MNHIWSEPLPGLAVAESDMIEFLEVTNQRPANWRQLMLAADDMADYAEKRYADVTQ